MPSVLVVLSSTLALTLMAGAWSRVEGWRPIDWSQLGWLGLGAGFLVLGVPCAVASLRRGALSTVAPFRYLSLPFALLLGFAVWGELPGPLGWAGTAVIAISGLCVLRGAKLLPERGVLRQPGKHGLPCAVAGARRLKAEEA